MLKSWLKCWQVAEVCNKFGTKVNNHGTTEKEKTCNSVNTNVNNPYPNQHLIWKERFFFSVKDKLIFIRMEYNSLLLK